jgi:hypothetical protein
VDGLSYNQLVEKIISNKNSNDSNLVSLSLVAQNFLEESASQLTYHGLCELVATMKEDELAIFFRNNHFSTIYKHKNVSKILQNSFFEIEFISNEICFFRSFFFW